MRIGVQQGGERVAEQRPVEEQMDAYDRRVLERGIGLAEQVCGFGRRRRDDDRVGVEILQRCDALAGADRRAGRLERPACGIAVHPPQRSCGEDDVARCAIGEQSGAHREDAPLGAHVVGAEVQCRPDEDVPEASDRLIRAAELAEQRAEGLLVGSALRQAAHGLRHPQPVSQREMAVPEERRGRAADGRRAAVFGDHRQVKGKAAVRPTLADAFEEAEVLGEAAQRDVLAVVGRWLGSPSRSGSVWTAPPSVGRAS